MRKSEISVFFILLLCLSFYDANAEEMRTWVSLNGKYKTEATYVGVSSDENVVTLLKSNGTKVNVSVEKLSIADQRFIRQKAAQGQTAISVTKENFIQYDDNGDVVFRGGTSGEQRKRVTMLLPDEMNCLLELETAKYTDEKYFTAAKIKEQIDAYFTANPIKTEVNKVDADESTKQQIADLKSKSKALEVQQKQIDAQVMKSLGKNMSRFNELSNKSSQIFDKKMNIDHQIFELENEKTEIERKLTPLELNSTILALLKYQEAADEKYDEYFFKDIMEKITNAIQYYSKKIDVYMLIREMPNVLFGRDYINSSAGLKTLEIQKRVHSRLIASGELSEEIALEMTGMTLDRIKKSNEKNDELKKTVINLLPYANKYSWFRHAQEESERLKEVKEEERKKAYDEKSKDMFK